MYVENVLISLAQILVQEGPFGMLGLEQPARGKWPPPRPEHAPAPWGGSVFAEVIHNARGDCATTSGHTSCLQTGLMGNFCSFLLPQGLPSPRFRHCHPAASHSAAHLLKNRYGGMGQSCSRKWMGGSGGHCVLQEPGVL